MSPEMPHAEVQPASTNDVSSDCKPSESSNFLAAPLNDLSAAVVDSVVSAITVVNNLSSEEVPADEAETPPTNQESPPAEAANPVAAVLEERRDSEEATANQSEATDVRILSDLDCPAEYISITIEKIQSIPCLVLLFYSSSFNVNLI